MVTSTLGGETSQPIINYFGADGGRKDPQAGFILQSCQHCHAPQICADGTEMQHLLAAYCWLHGFQSTASAGMTAVLRTALA